MVEIDDPLIMALVRLDGDELRKQLGVIGIECPNDQKAFWLGIHKWRATEEDIPDAHRNESREWLRVLGIDATQLDREQESLGGWE
jgi:hypothetical protein